MLVLGRLRIAASMKKHASLRAALEAWVAEVERAQWAEPANVRARFQRASFVTQRRVVFRLNGNRYRLIALVRFASESSSGTVNVLWIGTHAEYDKIDARTICGSSAEEPDHEHSTDPVRRRLRVGSGQNRVADGPRRSDPGPGGRYRASLLGDRGP